MPIKVLIPTPLRPYAGKQPVIEVNAQTVGEALSDLVAQHPDLRKHLFSEDGKLRSLSMSTSTRRHSLPEQGRYAGHGDGHDIDCSLGCRR
jgi:molybdopterin converting factor small subunit